MTLYQRKEHLPASGASARVPGGRSGSSGAGSSGQRAGAVQGAEAWRLCFPKRSACGRRWLPRAASPPRRDEAAPSCRCWETRRSGRCPSRGPLPQSPSPRLPTASPPLSHPDPSQEWGCSPSHRAPGAGPQPTAALAGGLSPAISAGRQGGDGSPLVTTDRINQPRPLPLITQLTASSSRTPGLWRLLVRMMRVGGHGALVN